MGMLRVLTRFTLDRLTLVRRNVAHAQLAEKIGDVKTQTVPMSMVMWRLLRTLQIDQRNLLSTQYR